MQRNWSSEVCGYASPRRGVYEAEGQNHLSDDGPMLIVSSLTGELCGWSCFSAAVSP